MQKQKEVPAQEHIASVNKINTYLLPFPGVQEGVAATAIKESPAASSKLRNFDLTVEEIRIVRAIKEMTEAFQKISESNPDPSRLDFYAQEIKKLEEQLDDIRENTLIR